MKPNNRITYRFDVPERQPAKIKPERLNEDARRPVEEESAAAGQAQLFPFPQNNVIPLYQQHVPNHIDEAQPWNNGYQEDIGALEQLIREANAEAGSEGAEPPNSGQAGTSGSGVRPALDVNDDESRNLPELQPSEEWRTIESLHASGAKLAADRGTPISFDGGMGMTDVDEDISPTRELWETRRASPIVPAIARRTGGNSGKGPSWLHVFLSVGGALATGAIFGYLILALFTGASIWPGGDSGSGSEAPPVVQPAVKEPIGLDDLTGQPKSGKAGVVESNGNGSVGAPSGGSSAAATVNVEGVASSYTLLQYGLFSNTEGRDAALKQLKDAGLAAASMKTAEGYRVYAGIARDGAKAGVISAGLQGVTLFKKEVSVNTPERLPFGGAEETARTFFSSTSELIGIWSDLVVAQLEQPSLSPLSKAASDGWRDRHKQWTAQASAMQEGVKDEAGETYFAKLSAAMDRAAASMSEYDKKPSKAHLWSAETALMEAVLTQKEWFESTSAL